MEEGGIGPGRRPGFARDLTKGSIIGNLLRLSWPMVISNVLMMLGPTIDMIWVGKLGSASIAGVGVSGIAVQLIMGAMMGLIMGMRAMVARFVGAGDVRAANHVAQQALVISGGFAVLAMVIGIFFTEQILGLFGLEADVVAEGAAYLRVMFVGAAAMAFRIMAEGVMQASGDAVTPMAIAVIYRLSHVALAPFLIFGWWIFPQLGVRGAAVTNIVSQTLGLSLGLWFLFGGRQVSFGRAARHGTSGGSQEAALAEANMPAGGFVRFEPSRLPLTLRNFRLDPNIIWRIVRIGLPAMVSGMQRTFSQFFLMLFMAPFGTAAVAAHTIVQRVEMILFMPGMSFGTAAGVLVGQNLGASKPERAERSAWLAAGLVAGIIFLFSMGILLSGEGIVRIFNREPDLVALGATFLRIAVAGYIVLPLTAVFMSALSGAGDTVPPMLISLLTIWAIQLPLAFFLPRVGDLGAYGVRWAIVAGLVIGGVSYVSYFRAGRWKRKRL